MCDDIFEPLVELDMDTQFFDTDWKHCDHVSTYLSQVVSHNRKDPLMFANLFSATVNEILETVYRTRKEPGMMRCQISRNGRTDRVELTVPCAEEEQQYFVNAAAELSAPEAADKYIEVLFSEDNNDRITGLYELVTSYNARVSAERTGNNAIRLAVDVEFED